MRNEYVELVSKNIDVILKMLNETMFELSIRGEKKGFQNLREVLENLPPGRFDYQSFRKRDSYYIVRFHLLKQSKAKAIAPFRTREQAEKTALALNFLYIALKLIHQLSNKEVSKK